MSMGKAYNNFLAHGALDFWVFARGEAYLIEMVGEGVTRDLYNMGFEINA